MYYFKLILRNSLRHKLRTALTTLGIVVAVLAFGLLQTLVDAWYAGAEAASGTRLVTRNAISLVFPLPITYAERIRQVEGRDQRELGELVRRGLHQRAQLFPAVRGGAAQLLRAVPGVPRAARPDEGVSVRPQGLCGRAQARRHLWLEAGRRGARCAERSFPGSWEFVVRAIYTGAEAKTDTSQFFFHWDYLNETLKRTAPRRANSTGIFLVGIGDADAAAQIAANIDRTFRNSLAETLTETEKAFQLGFVSMSEAIVVAIRAVSFVVIVIIMAVMANTMAMAARERLAEYATLKALGFRPGFLRRLIVGRIAADRAGRWRARGRGDLSGHRPLFGPMLGNLFPVFQVSPQTMALQLGAALVIGLVAAVVPSIRASRVRIAEGLRAVG